ncbi:MAG TPA: hypothetical protein VLX09_12635 [Stellaceae bacterium]|nr:hypothetical protein [Stellaceae bacterium]
MLLKVVHRARQEPPSVFRHETLAIGFIVVLLIMAVVAATH